jgi:hypothetical protein
LSKTKCKKHIENGHNRSESSTPVEHEAHLSENFWQRSNFRLAGSSFLSTHDSTRQQTQLYPAQSGEGGAPRKSVLKGRRGNSLNSGILRG